MRPLLVGEANPRGADPRMALYPLPPQCAGGRLCKLLGMSVSVYLATFDRVNLMPTPPRKWSAPEARRAAEHMLVDHPRAFPYVLLGRKVATAFGLKDTPFFQKIDAVGPHGAYRTFLVIPHPSGLCQVWNDPATVQVLRRLLNPFIKEAK